MSEDRSTPRRRIAREVVLFVIICVASAVVLLWLHDRQSRLELTVLRLNERNHVLLLRATALRDFRAIVSDLRIIAGDPTILDYIEPERRAAETATALDALSDRLASFCRHRGIYDQIRYIESGGKEVVRIDLVAGRAERAGVERLQDKSDRYYVAEANELRPGEIFMSPFDLNVEDGIIEQPAKPTIRFATPVFDTAGRRHGFVIVNYLGELLLHQLDRVSVNAPGLVMLLNADGYWLRGPEPADEWAFMYDDREQRTFGKRFPSVWERIVGEDTGQVLADEGLFTFQTIDPLAGRGARRWKAVSFVSRSAIVTTGRTRARWLLAAYAVVVAGSGLGARSLWHARAEREEARFRALRAARLAAIGEAMAGLAHESRNALQRTQACLEMLSARVADRPGAIELLDQLQCAQDDLHRLFEDVREWAAPLRLHREPCDILALVQAAWADLRAAHDHGAVLEIDAEAVNTTIEVDPFVLRQVLRNVLENAVAANRETADQGHPDSVQVSVAESRPGELVLSIRDHGPGFDEERAARAFEPFYTTRARGTGLGLAIARRIIEEHRGTITVRARTPGAEIIITLPRHAP